MDTRYNKEEEEDERMTLDSKTSNPDPPNIGQVIDSDDETDTTGNCWKNTTKPILTTKIPTSS